jgi:hypothetical protein
MRLGWPCTGLVGLFVCLFLFVLAMLRIGGRACASLRRIELARSGFWTMTMKNN